MLEKVGLEQRADVRVLSLLDGGEVAVARIVDEHVDRAEALFGRSSRRQMRPVLAAFVEAVRRRI